MGIRNVRPDQVPTHDRRWPRLFRQRRRSCLLRRSGQRAIVVAISRGTRRTTHHDLWPLVIHLAGRQWRVDPRRRGVFCRRRHRLRRDLRLCARRQDRRNSLAKQFVGTSERRSAQGRQCPRQLVDSRWATFARGRQPGLSRSVRFENGRVQITSSDARSAKSQQWTLRRRVSRQIGHCWWTRLVFGGRKRFDQGIVRRVYRQERVSRRLRRNPACLGQRQRRAGQFQARQTDLLRRREGGRTI